MAISATEMQQWLHSQIRKKGVNAMATYIILKRFTDQGIKSVKDAPQGRR